jgi:serine protease AprX
MPGRIDPDFLTRILYGAPDGMRYTQDSPALREVWLRFAKFPEDPCDVLIMPWESCEAADVAAVLHERVVAFRRAAKLGKRKESDISDLPGIVAARVYFDELFNLLLPQTRWWTNSGLAGFLTLPKDRQREHVARWAASLKKSLRTATHEFLTAKVPFDASGPADDDGGPSTDAGREREDATTIELDDSVARLIVLAGLIVWLGRALEAEKAAELREPEDIDPEGVATAWLELTGRGPVLPRDGSAEIFSINANRRVETAVVHSVPTTKADAAYRLFGLDCSRIGWAIVDSGIDSEHCAFGKRDANGALLGEHRIVASYDFSRFRRLRSRSEMMQTKKRRQLAEELSHFADPEGHALPPERANEVLDSMHGDLLHNRPTDFAKIEELLRIRQPVRPNNAHGTHVAGILGGDGSSGDVRYRGMCPDIQLYDFRVIPDDPHEAEFAVIGALRLINHLNKVNNFIRIHGANLSLQLRHDVMNYACGRTPICTECEALVRNGVVVVAAAGNQGFHEFMTRRGEVPLHIGTSITDPGNAELVITVGSTHRIEPHNYGVSYFSSRGPTGDGRPKPDLVAPGEKIMAPVPQDRWARKGGTSMAAPHVSGAAAMLMARFPELIGRPDRIKAILCQSATDLGRERAYQGSGLLDVLRALQSV